MDPVHRDDQIARAHSRFRCGAERALFGDDLFEPNDLNAARRKREPRSHPADIIIVCRRLCRERAAAEQETACRQCGNK